MVFFHPPDNALALDTAVNKNRGETNKTHKEAGEEQK